MTTKREQELADERGYLAHWEGGFAGTRRLRTVRERTERASEQAYVVNPGGSVVELPRSHAFPTVQELEEAIHGEPAFLELEGHQGLTLVYAEESWDQRPRRNVRASEMAGKDIYGPVVVLSRRVRP